jgi:small subunit ribosomal protein S1
MDDQDDFMTDRNNGAQDDASENEMARYLDEPVHALRSVKRGDVVEGTVVAIDRDEILVDIGLKSEAVLPLKELSQSGYGSLDEIHVNDRLLVFVLQPENSDGHAVVSVRKARQEHQWRIAQEMYERGDIIDAEVVESNKGGLIVNLNGVRGFVPISQISNLKREDNADNAETQTKLQAMVGKLIKLKIIEINRNRNRLILSERQAMQEWRTRRRDELLSELQVGDVRRGVVSNLAHFGAFVDLGGADGLVHISQLAWSRVNHPSEVLHIGQEVEVQVLNIDKERKKIALSIKRAETDPWTTVEQRYTPGQIVTGVVTKLAPFGAFARIENGIEGLIHVSEIYPPTNDPKSVLKEGQEVQVRVLRIESDRRRLGLSMRAVAAPDAAVSADEGPRAAAVEAPQLDAASLAGNRASETTTAMGEAFSEALTRQNANGHVDAAAQPQESPQVATKAEDQPKASAASADEATEADAQAPAASANGDETATQPQQPPAGDDDKPQELSAVASEVEAQAESEA